ncbi:membrane protein [Rhizobium leguminosarum bv. trifolii WSM1689]|uniref:hypothetical protein n=2 Tax=Rhizobium leguminosarum TaxID=384 RepID=UPI0003E0BFC0|nr:hypothetical protein [Rhizobium leguminosarum]AHF85145.1 membrane protein [Rhizobium leguminosarum bv. trifolii WSM1689]
MQLIDPNHPAYRRLWVRVAIVAVCFGWAVVEFVTGDPFWGVLAGGAGAYSFYILFWTFKPQPPETAAVVTPDDADGDEPALDEEKKAEEKKAE